MSSLSGQAPSDPDGPNGRASEGTAGTGPGNGVLASAAEGVLRSWPEDSAYRTPKEVENLLRGITVAAACGSRVNWPPEIVEGLARDRPLVRRLLRALRLEILSACGAPSGHCTAEAALAALRGLETLEGTILPREAQEFAARLTDPDGFELLVEVAHDLRSPLTSITFMAETLRAGHSGELTDLQKSQLGLIWSAAFAMMSVFSDLMDLARERSSIFEDSPGPFSISGCFEDLRQMVEPMVVVKGIELRLKPPLHERVVGHRLALFRVLLNLATNAIKFTEEGFVEVSARTVDRNLVEFSVRDTGHAIPEEAQQTLFEPFKKARDRRGYFFSGSGLGLSIARRYVRAMGSDLRFETKPGWGTRFHFQLELSSADDYRGS
jgi:signal transduction histidine kinase